MDIKQNGQWKIAENKVHTFFWNLVYITIHQNDFGVKYFCGSTHLSTSENAHAKETGIENIIHV